MDWQKAKQINMSIKKTWWFSLNPEGIKSE